MLNLHFTSLDLLAVVSRELINFNIIGGDFFEHFGFLFLSLGFLKGLLLFFFLLLEKLLEAVILGMYCIAKVPSNFLDEAILALFSYPGWK